MKFSILPRMERPNDILFEPYRIPAEDLAVLESAPPQGSWKQIVKRIAEAIITQDDGARFPRHAWRTLVDEVIYQDLQRYNMRDYKRLVDQTNPVDGFANRLADFLQLNTHSPLRHRMVEAEQSSPQVKAGKPSSTSDASDQHAAPDRNPAEERERRHDHVAADVVPLGTREERAVLAATFDHPIAPGTEGQSRRTAKQLGHGYAERLSRKDTRNPYAAVHTLAARARGGRDDGQGGPGF